MADKTSLKSQNARSLWAFTSINLAVFLSFLVAKSLAGASIDQFWKRVTTKDGVIAAAIPIATVVLSGVLSDNAKARIVFWRWRNPLPGCRAFSKLVHTDPRIDMQHLEQKIGEFPTDAHAQNALWYKLYKKHTSDVAISDAHRVYLLTRDMGAMSLLFFFGFSVGAALVSSNWKSDLAYSGALLLQFLLITSAARNYGNRFVLNVLAATSHA